MERKQQRLREVARVIGLMISSFSAVEYGPLFYRQSKKDTGIEKSQGEIMRPPCIFQMKWKKNFYGG